MTTLSQYLQAEDPDWSEPETFNLPHARRTDAPAGVRAIGTEAPTPFQKGLIARREKQNARMKANAIARARALEQAAWEKQLANDGLAPI